MHFRLSSHQVFGSAWRKGVLPSLRVVKEYDMLVCKIVNILSISSFLLLCVS